MKSVRRTLAATVLLLLIGAGCAGGYVVWLWNRSDQLLAKTMREKLAEIAPDWNVSFRRARLELPGKVHLHDVVIPGEDPAAPVLEMAELILSIDRETLADPQPDIQHVRIVRPRVNLARGSDGTWNVSRLPPLRHSREIVPEIVWEQGTIVVQIGGDRASAAPLRLQNVTVRMVPEGKRRFLITSKAAVAGMDELAVEGRWSIEDKSWSAQGTIRNLTIDDPLLDLGARFSGEFAGCLERFRSWKAPVAGRQGNLPAGERGRAMAGADGRGEPARAQVSAAADLTFQASRRGPEADAEYRLSLALLRGELVHPALGYPLRELTGRISIDDGRIEVEDLSARSAGTQVEIKRGAIRQQGDLRPFELDMSVAELPLDERLHRLLPADMQKTWNLIRPKGRIDATLHLAWDGAQRWEHQGQVTVRDASASHVAFPYQIDQINGTVKCANETVELALAGTSGLHQITLKGQVKGKPPEAGYAYHLATTGLPIDAKLRAACAPRVQAAIDRLALQGDVAGSVWFTKERGPGQVLHRTIKARLGHGTIRFDGFPYPLSEVTGTFENRDDVWDFVGFRGRQGRAEVTSKGARIEPGPDGGLRFDLDFDAVNAACDDTLFAALSLPLRETWTSLQPQGTLHAWGHVGWSEALEPELDLHAELRDGKLRLEAMPVPFEEVQADLDYEAGKVTIRKISGRHEETKFRARGTSEFADGDEWHLRLEDLHVDDLVFTRTFRKALPPTLQRVVDAFDPHGKLSVSGDVAFRGLKGRRDNVTAAWNTTTVYTGNTINAGGIELKDLHGTVEFLGTWDGQDFSGEGWIDLNAARIFERYRLADIKGPIRIAGEKLIVGSNPSIGRQAPPGEQIEHLTARFINGTISLDAFVEFGPPLRYDTRITLANGDLQQYARAYMPGYRKLAGVMNGVVDLRGAGNEAKNLLGKGRLIISPAELYDLPLIVAIFKELSSLPVGAPAGRGPGKDPAFDQALFVFQIRDSNVLFEKIDLVGDAMHLVGGGNVTFKGEVFLDFLSDVGRRQLAIPILREVIRATTNGMVGVRVRGSLRDPSKPLDTKVTPFQQIDSAVRGLLTLFDPPSPRGPKR